MDLFNRESTHKSFDDIIALQRQGEDIKLDTFQYNVKKYRAAPIKRLRESAKIINEIATSPFNYTKRNMLLEENKKNMKIKSENAPSL